MAGGDRLVPRDSAVYQEFARLHELAHEARPTGVDRWSGDLYATYDGLWGGFDPRTGNIRLSAELVLRHLGGTVAGTELERGHQAEALAVVLHEATQTGMETDALREPNAVRSLHSKGVMEGVAELRTTFDFQAFTNAAGYPGLTLQGPQYAGAHAAVDNLITQASEPTLGRQSIIDKMTQGPAVMHFDQLAEGIVQNRLTDVVPNRAEGRQAVRAALIPTMMHPQWPTLSQPSSALAGHLVAEDIRPFLNTKVDEIRHHYQAHPHQPFPADSPNQYAVRRAAQRQLSSDPEPAPTPTESAGQTAPDPIGPTRQAASSPSGPDPQLARAMRLLDGQPPAAHATRPGPSLGNGARGAGAPATPGSSRSTPKPDRGRD